MSRRSKYCEFSNETRRRIKERDGGCIFCRMLGHSGFPPSQIAHYVARSQGGLGIERNGALVCVAHHAELDNGMDTQFYKDLFRGYLIDQYGDNWQEEALFYDKYKTGRPRKDRA